MIGTRQPGGLTRREGAMDFLLLANPMSYLYDEMWFLSETKPTGWQRSLPACMGLPDDTNGIRFMSPCGNYHYPTPRTWFEF